MFSWLSCLLFQIKFEVVKNRKTTISGIFLLIVSVLLGAGKLDAMQAEGLRALLEPLMGVFASFGLFFSKDAGKD